MQSKNNEVRIGKQDFRFYSGQCNVKFRSNDQVELLAMDSFKEKLIYVYESLMGVGITLDKGYKDSNGKPNPKPEVYPIEDEKTGRSINKIFYRLGLTKTPEIFMFTKPDEKMIIPGAEEYD